jgi:hypothetical protein
MKHADCFAAICITGMCIGTVLGAVLLVAAVLLSV